MGDAVTRDVGRGAPIPERGPVVLVVDDDAAVRRIVRGGLEREGFSVCDAANSTQALDELAARAPSLVILDVNLGPLGGFDVLSRIRALSRVPVILLTGRVSETDRVLGLELGADDYVVKPFSPRELAARGRAVLRRTTEIPGADLDFGQLRIDTRARRVRLNDAVVELTAKEFDLLAFLASSPREVFSRKQLLESVWHSAGEWQDPSTITEHVHRLRGKLESDKQNPMWIRTVRAAGYAFEPRPPPATDGDDTSVGREPTRRRSRG
jgi:DNA-binding response OmpR family regulator